jgi:hypothetical protein
MGNGSSGSLTRGIQPSLHLGITSFLDVRLFFGFSVCVCSIDILRILVSKVNPGLPSTCQSLFSLLVTSHHVRVYSTLRVFNSPL